MEKEFKLHNFGGGFDATKVAQDFMTMCSQRLEGFARSMLAQPVLQAAPAVATPRQPGS